jgi:hypothetical protein
MQECLPLQGPENIMLNAPVVIEVYERNLRERLFSKFALLEASDGHRKHLFDPAIFSGIRREMSHISGNSLSASRIVRIMHALPSSTTSGNSLN